MEVGTVEPVAAFTYSQHVLLVTSDKEEVNVVSVFVCLSVC